MKKDTSDLFEEEIMENELAEALEQEQTALLEIELEKEIGCIGDTGNINKEKAKT